MERIPLTTTDAPAKAVPCSGNDKTGPVAATYASQASCPKTCPHRGDTCYAEKGPLGHFLTARLNASPEQDPDRIAEYEADLIDALPGDRDLRLHVVGDCPTEYAARIVANAAAAYQARGRRLSKARHGVAVTPRVWTYTHAWRTVPVDAWHPVSVLASCESVSDAAEARERGYAVALLVPFYPPGSSGKAFTHHGIKLMPCLETVKKVPCIDCRRCFDADRLKAHNVGIAFVPCGGEGNARKLRQSDLLSPF